MDAIDRRTVRPSLDPHLTAAAVSVLALLFCMGLGGGTFWLSHAQVSVTGRGKNFVAPVTDAQGRKTVLRGKDVKPGARGLVEITGMLAETYRGQEKDLLVQAPQCSFDTKSNVASGPSSLSIRTADDRFSIQGEGFRWQLGDSRLNSKLTLSNRVHSLIRKRLINPKAVGSALGVPGNRPPKGMVAGGPNASTNEFIEISSEAFEHQSDVAVFRGKVHVHDSAGDLTCGVLSVFFQGESGALEKIEAEHDVVLTQEGTRAIADKGVYTLGQGKELVELVGHAVWQDGERQGSGERVTFDRRTRTVRVDDRAYLRIPRDIIGESGFLSASPAKPQAGTRVATDFVEVFSDRMTIRLPATNGPVQQIVAEKNVLIVDAEQAGRALADRAAYEEATGVLELTGTPLLESEHRLINAKSLRFDRDTKVFAAGPDAYLKLPVAAIASLGVLSERAAAHIRPDQTNEFVEVWCQQFEFHTNLLHFSGTVRANFLEGDRRLGQLTCATLTIRHGEHLESMSAEDNVELEQFVEGGGREPTIRRIQCRRLTAKFTGLGLLEAVTAEEGVTGEQEETRPGRATPVLTRVQAESLTAFFSAATNQVERIVAEKDVFFTQDERSAQGAKAVYTEATGLVELTGEPTAYMPEGRIREADRLVWDSKNGRLVSKGKFRSEWKRPASVTNILSGSLSRTR